MDPRIERFGRILKLRENDRQTEQVILAEERQEEDTVLRHLDLLGDEKSQALKAFGGCGSAGGETVSLQEIWFQRQTVEVIEKHIGEDRQSLSNVQLRITATETRLKERHRDVRLMEGYVDRLRMDVRKIALELEQIELDDITVTRFGHASVQAANQAAQSAGHSHQSFPRVSHPVSHRTDRGGD